MIQKTGRATGMMPLPGTPVISEADLEAAFAGPQTHSSLAVSGLAKIGGSGWLEALITSTEGDGQFVALSKAGGSAGVFGTRSSDCSTAGSQGGFSIGSFGINDNAAKVQTTYCGYFEARRYPGAGVTEGLEIGMVNIGPPRPARDPYTIGSTGDTIGLLVGSGRADVAGNSNNTCAIFVSGDGSPAGSRWLSGLVFKQDSIVAGHAGFPYPVAIDMVPGYAMTWRGSYVDASTPAPISSYVLSTSTTATTGGRLLFDDPHGIALVANAMNGSSVLIGNGVTINGAVKVAGDVEIDNHLTVLTGMSLFGLMAAGSDSEAATKGVGISGVYVNSTGGLQVRLA